MSKPNVTNANLLIQRARSNLILAKKGKRKGVILDNLCYNAQQAAEKALTAICIFHASDFPKTHSSVCLAVYWAEKYLRE